MARWFLYPDKTEAPTQPAAEVPDFFSFSVESSVEWIRTLIAPSRQEPVFIPIVIAGAVITGGLSEPAFAKDFQYQATVDPIVISETVTVDKWHRPLSEPTRRAGFRTYFQQSTVTDAEPVVSFGWFDNLSEPVRQKIGLGARYQEAFWPSVIEPEPDLDTWYRPLEEPVRLKPGLKPSQQKDLWWVFTPTEIITVDKWHNWLSEPVRLKAGLAAQRQQFFQPDQEPQVSFGWVYPWSEPVRLKPGLGAWQQPVFTTDLEPIVSFGWNYGYSEPVRQKRGLGAWLQRDLFWDPKLLENVTLDKWFGWLSEPVKIKPSLKSAYQQTFQPDSEPQVSFGWIYPWSEPVRQKPGLGAHLQQAFTIDPWLLTQEEQVSEDKWHQKWPDFATRKTQPHPAYQQTLAFWPFPISGETVTLDKYWQPFSEPVRVKPGLHAARQQFFTIDPYALTQLETVTESRWHQPWSEPVRTKIGLRAALQSPYTAPIFVAETVTVDKWFKDLSEPVRQKRGLAASRQAFFWPDVEPVVSFGWFEPFSEPVRTKPSLRTAIQPVFTTDTEPTVSFGWRGPLSEPVRVKYLSAAQQSVLAWDAFTPTAVTDIRWFGPLSEPLRRKAGLTAAQQSPPLAWGIFTPAEVPAVINLIQSSASLRARDWRIYRAIQEPTLVALPPQLQFGQTTLEVRYQPWRIYQTWTAPVFVPSAPAVIDFVQTSVDVRYRDWRIYRTLQEPTALRIPPQLQFSETTVQVLYRPWRIHQTYTAPVSTAPETVTEDRWHQPWSEPKRFRPALGAYRTPALFMPGKIDPTVADITVILNATEQGDVLAGTITLRYCRQANTAIVEIVPDYARIGAIPVGTVTANVSVTEVRTVFAHVSVREIC